MEWKAYYVTKNKKGHRFLRVARTTKESQEACLKAVREVYRVGRRNYKLGRFCVTSKTLADLKKGFAELDLTNKFSIV